MAAIVFPEVIMSSKSMILLPLITAGSKDKLLISPRVPPPVLADAFTPVTEIRSKPSLTPEAFETIWQKYLKRLIADSGVDACAVQNHRLCCSPG